MVIMEMENEDQVSKRGCLCPQDPRGGVITPKILGGGVITPRILGELVSYTLIAPLI